MRLKHRSVASVWSPDKLKHEQGKQDARKQAAALTGAAWALSVVPQDMSYTIARAHAEAERWCREKAPLHAPLVGGRYNKGMPIGTKPGRG